MPSGRRLLVAGAGAALVVTLALVLLLTRPPGALSAVSAAAFAVPLAFAGIVVLLPVSYLCRALPASETGWLQLLTSHGGAAALMGFAWAYFGTSLGPAIAFYRPEEPVVELYGQHRTAVVAGGACLYLLTVAFQYVALSVEAARRAEQQSLELGLLAREAELRALKAQIQPHFLFNSLNSISSLTSSNPARAREMCILLAEFFRRSLAVGERPSVTLEEELAIARTYLAIEAIRFGARLQVEEAIEPAALACQLPPLLLQPLIENAVRHGIATCVEGGVLRVTARLDQGRLRVEIENPFDPEAPPRRGAGLGLGLTNVRRRLQTRYAEGMLFDAQRSGERFRVVLALPAEEQA